MRCYSDLLRQTLPMQRLYLPSLSQVGELSCFRELLNPDRDVQAADWEHAATWLPGSLSEWMSEHRDRYSSLLPFQVCGSQDKAMEVKLLSDPHEAMDRFAGRLDLAISVFRHLDTNTIHVGRDVCHAWKLKGELEFLERGAEAGRALLGLLNLDPATTTASMLDQLDTHFVCASCPTERDWLHRPWKSCVNPTFFSRNSLTTHLAPWFRLCISSIVRKPIIPTLNGVWCVPMKRVGPACLSTTLPEPKRGFATTVLVISHPNPIRLYPYPSDRHWRLGARRVPLHMCRPSMSNSLLLCPLA